MKITRNANRIVMLAAIVFMAIGGVMTRGEEVADGVPVEDEEVIQIVPRTHDARQFFSQTLPRYGFRVHLLAMRQNLLIPPELRFAASAPDVIIDGVAEQHGLSVWRNPEGDRAVLFSTPAGTDPAAIAADLTAEDELTRRRAAWAAGWTPAPSLVTPLVAAAVHEDAETARLARGSLARYGWGAVLTIEEDAWSLAEQIIAEADTRAAQAVMRGAGEAGGARAVEFLVPLLEKQGRLRYQAISALGMTKHPDAFQPLVEFAESNPEQKRHVVAALGQLGDERAVELLLAWQETADVGVRTQILRALGAIGNDAAVAALAGALENMNAQHRRRVIWSLGQAPSDAVEEPLRDMLASEDAGVVAAARTALISRGVEDAPELLREVFARAGQGGFMAGRSIGFGGDEAIEILTQAIQHGEAVYRYGAANGLGRVGGDEAAEVLIAVLETAERDMRRIASYALSITGSDKILEVLPDMLRDRTMRNVDRLVQACPPEKALPIVKAYLQEDTGTDPYHTRHAVSILQTPAGLPLARQLYNDGDSGTKSDVLRTVSQSYAPLAVELAEDALKSNDKNLQRAGVRALAVADGPDAAVLLEQAAQSDDPDVSAAAERALSPPRSTPGGWDQ